MSALATVITPRSWQPAIELADRTWEKKLLPVGSIQYQGRTLNFNRAYLEGLAEAFADGAYDQVPLQLADESNRHTNDPERTAGWIEGLELRPDGLYCLATVTERGERVLSENPRLGVSARIVEQYQRADGKFYPAAVQHVLGTLDPRIPALGAWTPVEMSNEGSGMIIDLSASTYPGDAPPLDDITDAELEALAADLTDEDLFGLTEDELGALIDGDGGGDLTDAELADLIDGLDDGQFTDDELAAWVDGLSGDQLADLEAEADADAAAGGELAEFANAFQDTWAAHQAVELAREQADERERQHPARSSEDIIARALSRAAQGTYVSSYGLGNQQLAVELANSAGLCAPADALGGCSARYHALGCGDHRGDAVELSSYGDALEGLSMSLADEGREDDGIVPVPAGYVELARELNESWELHSGATSYGFGPEADDLFDVSRSRDAYSDMAREVGYPELAGAQPTHNGHPDVSGLARELGLR